MVGLTAIVIALEEATAGSKGEAFAVFGYQRVGHRQVAARSCSAAITAIRVRQRGLARLQRCHQCCLGHCSAAREHRYSTRNLPEGLDSYFEVLDFPGRNSDQRANERIHP